MRRDSLPSLRCPLCGSLLAKRTYERVVGSWDARKTYEEELRRKVADLRAAKRQLGLDRKRMERELRQRMNERVKSALARGVSKEKKRADKLAEMIESKTEKIQDMNRTIRELQEQLKKGTTPQLEGLNLEEELTQQLKSRFKGDRVERFGKKGDVLHTVIYKGKTVGSIIFECKRTKTFNRSFITQARRAMVARSASYAVLVTTVFPRDSAGFSVSEDVFVVHPFGAGDLAEFLRQGLVELFSAKVSTAEMDRRAKALLDYAKGDDFRNAMEDSIHTTLALRDLLQKEMRDHRAFWEKRWEHYKGIYQHVSLVRENARRALRGEPLVKRIEEIKALPAPAQPVYHL